MIVSEELGKNRRMLLDLLGRRQARPATDHGHPSEDELADFAANDVEPDAATEIAWHLSRCPACAAEAARMGELAKRWAGDYGTRRLSDLGASMVTLADDILKGMPAPVPDQPATTAAGEPSRAWPRGAKRFAAAAAVLFVFGAGYALNDVTHRLARDVAVAPVQTNADAYGGLGPDGKVPDSKGAAAGVPGGVIDEFSQSAAADPAARAMGDGDSDVMGTGWVHAPAGPAYGSSSTPRANPSTWGLEPDLASDVFMVFFDLAKNTLSADARAVIAAAVKAYKANPNMKITVVGHADTTGPDAFNLRLSLRRAVAVADALQQGGVRATALQITGQGEQEAPGPTGQDGPERLNRRADIVMRPAAPPARPHPVSLFRTGSLQGMAHH
jgi:outer membrane protein OmpA-like peptidoglycan-associated protein